MCPVAVVTDSTATLPQELAEKYDIRVAPLYINWDRERYRDGIDIKPEEFYQRLRQSKTLPTTSGAVQSEFLDIFESLRSKVDGIVVFTVATELSAAYNSANIARVLVPDLPIKIVDSRMATIAMGFGVIAAAKKASTGGNMEEVTKAAKDIFSKVQFFFVLDTLDYLRRGGRVNLPAAVMANLLRVKPILTLNDGKVVPVARPRTRAKALEKLLDLMSKGTTDSPLHIGIMHGDDLDGVAQLKQKITARYNYSELVITDFTPVMGAHTGPGLLGIAFYNE